LDSLRLQSGALSDEAFEVATKLRSTGSIIMIGERLAVLPGAISAAVALAGQTGASLVWVPRRAGERGAADAGALPGLLPGGRPLTDRSARAQVAAVWGISADDLPQEPGLPLDGIVDVLTTFEDSEVLDVPIGVEFTIQDAPVPTDKDADGLSESASQDAAFDQESAADADETDDSETDEDVEVTVLSNPRMTTLVVAGVEIDDLARPDDFREALMEAEFVVNLETRLSAVSAYADVVLPVAVDIERSGSYTNWEGRVRRFGKVVQDAHALPDGRVLGMIAEAMGRSIGPADAAELRAELDELGEFDGIRPTPQAISAPVVGTLAVGTAVLATWRHLLDDSVLAQGEKYLAGTRRTPVSRMSVATAGSIGAADGDDVVISTEVGQIELPLVVTDMPDGVVWIPTNSPGSTVNKSLAAVAGSSVRIARGGNQ
ncbi:MAG: molybdopterin dinucleotide binding domain-containing protein, partial [Actinomycetes bacterium]